MCTCVVAVESRFVLRTKSGRFCLSRMDLLAEDLRMLFSNLQKTQRRPFRGTDALFPRSHCGATHIERICKDCLRHAENISSDAADMIGIVSWWRIYHATMRVYEDGSRCPWPLTLHICNVLFHT